MTCPRNDQFGRPRVVPFFPRFPAPDFALITGSLWPPRARSAPPPLDSILATQMDRFTGVSVSVRYGTSAGRRQ